nr:MAG: hypothetical protein [uncultured archaeon]
MRKELCEYDCNKCPKGQTDKKECILYIENKFQNHLIRIGLIFGYITGFLTGIFLLLPFIW